MKNTLIEKSNAFKSLVAGAAATTLAMGSSFAALDTDAATAAISESVTKGTAVVIAGFGIGALFLVAKVIRRGMRSAG